MLQSVIVLIVLVVEHHNEDNRALWHRSNVWLHFGSLTNIRVSPDLGSLFGLHFMKFNIKILLVLFANELTKFHKNFFKSYIWYENVFV